MTRLSLEVARIQNPAFGALLLWRFSIGYAAGAAGRGPAPQSLFLVLPILLHEETARFAIGTRTASGLRAFREKFTAARREDLLYAIHDRARELRPLTIAALQTAVHARLLVIDVSAEVLPVSQVMPRHKWAEEVRKLAAAAEKLGSWLAKVSLFETAAILGVRF